MCGTSCYHYQPSSCPRPLLFMVLPFSRPVPAGIASPMQEPHAPSMVGSTLSAPSSQGSPAGNQRAPTCTSMGRKPAPSAARNMTVHVAARCSTLLSAMPAAAAAGRGPGAGLSQARPDCRPAAESPAALCNARC